MKAIGYAGGHAFRCRWGAYSIVMFAPDRKTAREAFELFLEDRGIHTSLKGSLTAVKHVKHAFKGADCFWAHVDPSEV